MPFQTNQIWFRILLSLVFLLIAAPASPVTAQVATPDPDSIPTSEPPFSLATITLPADLAEAERRIAAMPETVDRESISDSTEEKDRTTVRYGDPMAPFSAPISLSVLSFPAGDFFPPDLTVGEFVAMTSTNDDYGATEFGRDGSLVWVMAESFEGFAGEKPGTPEVRRPLHTLAWGDIDSTWILLASADTPERLEALVTAFNETGS